MGDSAVRGSGKRKVARVNLSLTNNDSFKLERLAVACETKPTTLAAHMVKYCLNDPLFIKEVQDEFCIHSAYRILPIRNFSNGELDFSLAVNNKREDL